MLDINERLVNWLSDTYRLIYSFSYVYKCAGAHKLDAARMSYNEFKTIHAYYVEYITILYNTILIKVSTYKFLIVNFE